MIGSILKFLAIVLAGFTFLIWHQPATLLRVAAWMERGAVWLIRQLRIRAWSKAAADEAYAKSREFHRKAAE